MKNFISVVCEGRWVHKQVVKNRKKFSRNLTRGTIGECKWKNEKVLYLCSKQDVSDGFWIVGFFLQEILFNQSLDAIIWMVNTMARFIRSSILKMTLALSSTDKINFVHMLFQLDLKIHQYIYWKQHKLSIYIAWKLKYLLHLFKPK